MNYITVEDIKKYLYIDFDDDDAIIGDMIKAAEEIIAKRLNKDDLSSFEDKTENIPNPLLACIKIMVANMYNSRESVSFNATPQRIPYSLEYLLQPYKDYKRSSGSTCNCDDNNNDGGSDFGTYDANGNTLNDDN